MTADILAAALDYAARGWPVIPLQTPIDGRCDCRKASCDSPGKHPRTMNGLTAASTDAEQIRKWWSVWHEANIGLATGAESGLVVVDVDGRNGGRETLAGLELPETLTVETGDGLHFYFRHPGGAVPSNSGILPGIDRKADGGYVVAPPSLHASGRRYRFAEEWPADRPLAALPAFCLNGKQSSFSTTDTPGARIPQGQRNATLASLAGAMRRPGMTEDAIRAALLAENAARCEPPLSDADVARIAHSVGRYAPAEPEEDTPIVFGKTAQPLLAERLDELLDREDLPLDPIIGDGGEGAILTVDGKMVIAGATGVGKTNTLLRLSRQLCAGEAWLGFAVPRPRTVLYLLLEGSPRATKKRLRKIWADAPAEARERFHIGHVVLELNNKDCILALHALIADVRPDVLVIDPLRNAHPYDENASAEMAKLTGTLDAIIRRHGCALLLAHHDRKRPPFVRRDVGTDRLRGSTAFTGWVSAALSIDVDPSAPDRLTVEWVKTRDAESPLERLALDFDRATIDFYPTDRAPEGKVSDEAILTAVFSSGGSIRGTDLVRGFVGSGVAAERWVRERIRALVKDGKLLEYVAEADRKAGAKSYRLAGDMFKDDDI